MLQFSVGLKRSSKNTSFSTYKAVMTVFSSRSFTKETNALENEAKEVVEMRDGREVIRLNTKSGLEAFNYSPIEEANKQKRDFDSYKERGLMNYKNKDEINRKIRIFQRPKNPCRSGMDKADDFQVFSDRRKAWQDPLTGWYVKHDYFMSDNGLQNLTFPSAEAAEIFLKEKGYLDVVIEKRPTHLAITEPQDYENNFLNKHVQARRGKLDKKVFSKNQFKHQGRGKTCYVNLKHTQYGPKASKLVSGTQWSNPHPNNHTAKEWATNSFEKIQDQSKSKGKH